MARRLLPECERPAGAFTTFTLIELLVVIAIIAILASMLLPALSKSRQRVKFTVCGNNMRQIAMTVTMYGGDNDEHLPATVTWFAAPFVQQSQAAQIAYHYNTDNRRRLGYFIDDYMKAVEPFLCPLSSPRPEVAQGYVDKTINGFFTAYCLLWQNTTVGVRRLNERGDTLLMCDEVNVSGAEVLTGHPLGLNPGQGYSNATVWKYPGGTNWKAFATRMNACYLDGHVAPYRISEQTKYIGTFEYTPEW